MEELKYVVDDSTIVELLGLQNFTTSESAILELVKNAYDAGALHLCLGFNNDLLEIKDDGIGMDVEDIREHWMHIGKSDKGYQVVDENSNIRIQAGSKGVGRFALSRLGQNIIILSKKKNCDAVVWKTDWSNASVEKKKGDYARGTCIRIERLREKWSSKRIDNLCKYLELTYKDNSMEISVCYENNTRKIPQHFYTAKPGINCKSSITLNYENGVIITHVDSDEFRDEARRYCAGIDICHFESSVNIYNELCNSDIADIIGEELQSKIMELGSFSAKLYFNIASTTAEIERFLYKYKNTPENIEGGVILYRNAFSISSYEGKKDWLGLGKRSRKSPAAATHPTGAWRVRENQLAGYVEIDKKNNRVLQDLANRQGLDENEYYQLFIEIITIGIAEFERYRQKIIRRINIKNKEEEKKRTPVLDMVLKKPSSVKRLSDDEAKQLAMEIKDTKKGEKESRIIKEETEARYKYDVRILNVLATTGLKASSIAHEMKNDMSMLNSWYSLTVDALKSYGMWDELNTAENRKLAYKNVPELLSNTDETTRKISLFMATMLEDIEKRQFEMKVQEVLPLIMSIKKTWERDYAWIDIAVHVDDIEHLISEDVLRVVLDNLILNTVQQNEKRNHVSIRINVRKDMGLLWFDYYDDGFGLDKKYETNPMKILEVHETTRRNGHGLGMWIIHNTCIMSGGDVLNIEGDDGFHISFTIGGSI